MTTHEAHQTPYTHPEHTFLTTKQVFARYGWGRTRGYQMLATLDFPPRVGGSFRLDTLLAWEARELKRQMDAKTAATTDVETAEETEMRDGVASGGATSAQQGPTSRIAEASSTHGAEADPLLAGRRGPRNAKAVS
jgi:predicted DNA-binding transcriptional regulator AlpA